LINQARVLITLLFACLLSTCTTGSSLTSLQRAINTQATNHVRLFRHSNKSEAVARLWVLMLGYGVENCGRRTPGSASTDSKISGTVFLLVNAGTHTLQRLLGRLPLTARSLPNYHYALRTCRISLHRQPSCSSHHPNLLHLRWLLSLLPH
jgi:hypothetical protein